MRQGRYLLGCLHTRPNQYPPTAYCPPEMHLRCCRWDCPRIHLHLGQPTVCCRLGTRQVNFQLDCLHIRLHLDQPIVCCLSGIDHRWFRSDCRRSRDCEVIKPVEEDSSEAEDLEGLGL